MYWRPPIEESKVEEKIAKRTRKGRKLFVFLREHRHHIISKEFEQRLINTYREEEEGGKFPALPAQLAMATLLQTYCNVSDKEAIELTVMDKRWQMVLNCISCDHPPFSQGTLVNFRNRLIAHNLDKELLNRTVEVAEEYGGFCSRKLRAVLDSSPLFGAGRVEDTFNLLGHGLRKTVQLAAKELNKSIALVIEEAGLLLTGKSSLKAALDLDWGQADAKSQALAQILDELDRWKQWLEKHSQLSIETPCIKEAMETVEEIIEQDTESDGHGGRKIKQEVAKDRRVSIEDNEMRHGRKSKSKRFNGFKDHFLGDVDSQVIKEVIVRPANEPEHEVVEKFAPELETESGLKELYIDLGYAASSKIDEWEKKGVKVVARPWPERNRGFFLKSDFSLDFENLTITCPAGKEIPMVMGKTVHFPGDACNQCELRKQCTSAKPNKYRGRGVKIRHDEEVQIERRIKVKTPQGRAELRKRVVIEHRISHHIASQGRKARYIGTRKNQFDGRRHAAINNC